MTAWFGRGASGAVARGRARTPSSKASPEPALHGARGEEAGLRNFSGELAGGEEAGLRNFSGELAEGEEAGLKIFPAELAGGEQVGLRNFSGSFARQPTAVTASADAGA